VLLAILNYRGVVDIVDHFGSLESLSLLARIGEVHHSRERNRGSTVQLSISRNLNKDAVYLIVLLHNGDKTSRHHRRASQTSR
jgi:hypothetical protein